MLAGLVFVEMRAPPQVRTQTPEVEEPARAPLPAQPVYNPASIELYAELFERPLFAPSRRPAPEPAVVEDVVVAVPDDVGVELVGLVIAPGKRLALVREPGGTEPTWVAIGRAVAGWTVTRIEPDRVEFRSGERLKVLPLRENLAGAKTVPVPTGGEDEPSRGTALNELLGIEEQASAEDWQEDRTTADESVLDALLSNFER